MKTVYFTLLTRYPTEGFLSKPKGLDGSFGEEFYSAL